MWTEKIYKQIYEQIEKDWQKWALTTNAKKMVIGISGGKDSSVVAALATRIFGKDNVYGVLMPCGKQEDIDYSYKLIDTLGIESVEIDIIYAVESILNQLDEGQPKVLSESTKINLPARIRMSTLFAVAQTVDGRVINTCNLSENILGWSTIFGDHAGLYAPIQGLTATEVVELGNYLGLPEELTTKVPSDGLCGTTDEEKFGFKYKELDNFIRYGIEPTYSTKLKIYNMYNTSRFKDKLVQMPGLLKFSYVDESGEKQTMNTQLKF